MDSENSPVGEGVFTYGTLRLHLSRKEVTMFTLISILLLILFLPDLILPMVLKTLFTSNELNEMGVSLEESQIMPDFYGEPKNNTRKGHAGLCISLPV